MGEKAELKVVDYEALDILACRLARGELIGGTPYAKEMASLLCRAADALAICAQPTPQPDRWRPDVEAAQAALVVARICMEEAGHWTNAAGYLMDGALWIDRADSLLTVPPASTPAEKG